MEMKPSRSTQLMFESDGSAFAKQLLGGNSKTRFIGLLCTQYHIYWSAGERYCTPLARRPIPFSS